MFICTVGSSVPVDFFKVSDDDAVVVFPIGYDDQTGADYLVHVGLSPSGGGVIEYVFCLLVVEDGEVVERLWSGKDVRFMPPQARMAVLMATCTATEVLLNQIRPKSVFRCTYDADLPDKALEKHHVISQAFIRAGYRVCVADPYHGKRVWWAERESE